MVKDAGAQKHFFSHSNLFQNGDIHLLKLLKIFNQEEYLKDSLTLSSVGE